MSHHRSVQIDSDFSDLIPDVIDCLRSTTQDNVKQKSGSILKLPSYYKRMRLLTAKFIKERKDGSFYVTLIGREVVESFARNQNANINLNFLETPKNKLSLISLN